MLIVEQNSNQMNSPSQRCTARLAKPVRSFLLLILATGLGGAGCGGIYRDSSKIYPADPNARLRLRIDQARQAEKRAEQAAARLRDRFAEGLGGEQLAPDVDRLEMAAHEFDRCVAAVSDAAVNCEEADKAAAEVDAMRQRAAQLLEAIQRIRNDGIPSSLPLLDRLFPNPNRAGTSPGLHQATAQKSVE
jgi:hypothetical protein